MKPTMRPLDFEDGSAFANGNMAITHHSDGSTTVLWSLGEGQEQTGRCRVWFSQDDSGKAVQVQLYLFDGVTPSALSRFSWKKYISAAWASRLAIASPDPVNIRDLMLNLNSIRDGTPSPVVRSGSKRGRKGYGDDFFKKVAADYIQVYAQNSRSPVKQMAEEQGVSVATVRSWVHSARKRGLLPPGTRGRAG